MTRPDDPVAAAPGGEARPARIPPVGGAGESASSAGGVASTAPRAHDGLLVALVVLLLLRGLLSLWDAWSLSVGGVRALPISNGATVGGTPFWPLMWGGLTLLAAALLARRNALGWFLGVAASVAYLVAGIGDAALFKVDESLTPAAIALLFVDLAGPAAVLALLFSIRPWFLALGRRPPLRLAAMGDRPRR